MGTVSTNQDLSRPRGLSALSEDLVAAGGAISAPFGAKTMRWGVVGDSTAAYLEEYVSATSATANADGTVSVMGAGTSSGLVVGTPVRVQSGGSEAANITDGSVTAATTSTCVISPLSSVRSVQTGTPVISFRARHIGTGALPWLSFFLKRRFEYVWMAAGGNRISQISELIRRRKAVGISGVDALYISVGTNNIYASGQGIDTIKDEMSELLDLCAQFIVPTFVCTVPPRASSSAAWTSAKQVVHNKFNIWLAGKVKEYGFVLIDTWRATFNGETYVDGAAANPDPVTSWSTDGTHPTVRGGCGIAHQMLSLFSSAPVDVSHAHTAILKQDNYLTNPEFAGGTANPTSWAATASGGAPSTTRTTPARTIAADGDACGANWKVVFTDSTGGCTYAIKQAAIAGVAGKRVAFSWPAKLENLNNISLLQAAVWITTPGGIIVSHHGINGTSQNLKALAAWDGEFFVPEIDVPADATDVTCLIRFSTVPAAAASLTATVAHPELREA